MPADGIPAQLVLPELADPGTVLTLSSDDAHYVARVCRARAGDRLSATDGRGSRAVMTLTHAGPPASVRIESLDHEERASTCRLWCGAPEGERADWLIEKLAEFGVASLQPVDCERGRWEHAGRKMERWERLAQAALRQSMGRYRMEIRAPRSLGELLGAGDLEPNRWLADLEGEPPGAVTGDPQRNRLGAVGPSSGFSPEERRTLLGAGFRPIVLAGTRLRTETAALSLAAWWALDRQAPVGGGRWRTEP